MTIPTVKPEPPDSLIDETQVFWREAGKALIGQSLTTLDETAKQLITVSGVLIGLYFHALTFGNLRGKIGGWTEIVYLAPIVLVVFCLLFSLIVYFPDHSKLNLNSWEASKRVYERNLRSKLLAVRLASVFLLLGAAAIAVAAVAYLSG